VLRDDHAGTIEQVDVSLVRLLLDAGYLPVLTPPALALDEGVPINVDGDKLALELATQLGAAALLFFSDTPGLLRDKDDETSLIREIDASDPEKASLLMPAWNIRCSEPSRAREPWCWTAGIASDG
jgi:acetylglutamate/LysW-gamma-L-alpha-aminoadipate kinase